MGNTDSEQYTHCPGAAPGANLSSMPHMSIRGCARCGGNHDDVPFDRLIHPFTFEGGGAPYEFWAPCPKNGEPILLRVTVIPPQPIPDGLSWAYTGAKKPAPTAPCNCGSRDPDSRDPSHHASNCAKFLPYPPQVPLNGRYWQCREEAMDFGRPGPCYTWNPPSNILCVGCHKPRRIQSYVEEITDMAINAAHDHADNHATEAPSPSRPAPMPDRGSAYAQEVCSQMIRSRFTLREAHAFMDHLHNTLGRDLQLEQDRRAEVADAARKAAEVHARGTYDERLYRRVTTA